MSSDWVRECAPSPQWSGVGPDVARIDLRLLPGFCRGEATWVCSLNGWLWSGFWRFFYGTTAPPSLLRDPIYLPGCFYNPLPCPWVLICRVRGQERNTTKNCHPVSLPTPHPSLSSQERDLSFISFILLFFFFWPGLPSHIPSQITDSWSNPRTQHGKSPIREYAMEALKNLVCPLQTYKHLSMLPW